MNNVSNTLTALSHTTLDPAQQAEVQNLLRAHPDAWREFGNLFEWTRNEALSILHPNTVEYQSTVEGIRQLRQELEQSGDTALERIVIEQIINCHIQTAKTGFQLERVDPTGDSEPLAKHYARVHERAQRRLLRSMQVITRLRKANLELELKLRKNRPPFYDKSDYLRVAEDQIKARQNQLKATEQEEFEVNMEKNEANREIRRKLVAIEIEAKKLSLDHAWSEFLAKKKPKIAPEHAPTNNLVHPQSPHQSSTPTQGKSKSTGTTAENPTL